MTASIALSTTAHLLNFSLGVSPDAHGQAMSKKARFMNDAVGRLSRVKHYVERLPEWKHRVTVRKRATQNWNLAKNRVRSTFAHSPSNASTRNSVGITGLSSQLQIIAKL